jgi:cytochrome c
MRFAIERLLIVAAGTILSSAAFAQNTTGNVEAGRRFAEIWCSGCHAVELRTTRSGGIAPDFPSIAGRRATTARWLRVYLGKPHDKMPNFVLDKEDTDDVVAFLMSLKRR